MHLMKKVTAITVQRHRPNRVNVYLDGEFAFGLARIAAARLKCGDELSGEKIARLLEEDAREWAYQQALLFLGRRARSENEIRQNLKKHGVSPEVVHATLEKLRQAGLVDDNEFARAWVENRSTFRPRSGKAMAAELRQKGLDERVIQESLSSLDEESLAYCAASQRAARFKGLPWEEFRAKLGGFLLRRGFSYSVAASAVARIWNETQAEARRSKNENEDMV